MRYFLFLPFSITPLPSRIIEASRTSGLVLFSGPFQRRRTGSCGTLTRAIALSTITACTDNDLLLTTTAMIKAGGALHRQKADEGSIFSSDV